MIGAAEHLDKELEVLRRSVRVISCELMAQLLEDLGLIHSNIVKTPRVKLSSSEAEAIENSPVLDGEQATTFRSGTMRCAYLAQDCVDISEAIKCLARAMLNPKAHDVIETSGEVPEGSGQEKHCSTPRKSQAERTWKCTWTAIGLETQ